MSRKYSQGLSPARLQLANAVLRAVDQREQLPRQSAQHFGVIGQVFHTDQPGRIRDAYPANAKAAPSRRHSAGVTATTPTSMYCPPSVWRQWTAIRLRPGWSRPGPRMGTRPYSVV